MRDLLHVNLCAICYTIWTHLGAPPAQVLHTKWTTAHALAVKLAGTPPHTPLYCPTPWSVPANRPTSSLGSSQCDVWN
eukprot:3082256-Rhodomonas_salina.8